MKLLLLTCFLASLPSFLHAKQYSLSNDEEEASKYVYGLFGLTNVVGKYFLGIQYHGTGF